jgi:hypothetical protein
MSPPASLIQFGLRPRPVSSEQDLAEEQACKDQDNGSDAHQANLDQSVNHTSGITSTRPVQPEEGIEIREPEQY